MFARILIANRGEIAVRIMQTCAELGIRTLAVYSDADAGALHVRRADESYRLGPAPAAQSYLDAEGILEAARAGGAEAIHPGYGFLAESPHFAAACAAAGIVFVGPPADSMRQLGDKAAARRLARANGVPVVPGYDGADQEDGALAERAQELGFPLLIKAVAGGGGRGMRLVTQSADFAEALAAARREALAAFGDGDVLLERAVPSPRHVEVQVLADRQGNVIHLGERECSVQRRHQKVIEESPSPAVTPELRRTLGAAAVSIARAAGYVNAGTVEFLLSPSGEFHFLEVNTRLQVEHPVTELVTGLDLVREQLRIAAGERLTLRQEDVVLRGHALECRLYAEDPSVGFLPSTGTLLRFLPPEGPGLRNDVGVETGDAVTPHYDAMLGKLVAYGQDRDACLERATAALGRYVVLGVTTNLPLLRTVLASPEFRRADIAVDFLDRRLDDLLAPAVAPQDDALLAAAAWQVSGESNWRTDAGSGNRSSGQAWANAIRPYESGVLAAPANNPWRRGPWAVAGQGLTLRYRLGEAELAVSANRLDGRRWRFGTPAGEREVAVERSGAGELLLRVGEQVRTAWVAETEVALHVALPGRVVVLRKVAGLETDTSAAPSTTGGSDALRARMPGAVARIAVREGERVTEGQTLLVLNSMKTEHLVAAPRAGVVRRLPYTVGEQVPAGALLAELEG